MRILVYDLVSENRKRIQKSRFRKKVRAIRVKATEMLHQLGVQCTESVILVPDARASSIDDVINKINGMFFKILSDVENTLGITLPRPVIRPLTITEDQFAVFKELAERRLREALGANIDRVSKIAKSHADRKGSRRAGSLISSLKKLKREWLNIRRHVLDLGINVQSDIDRLVKMIDGVIASMRGQ